jgi:hypothetical protein
LIGVDPEEDEYEDDDEDDVHDEPRSVYVQEVPPPRDCLAAAGASASSQMVTVTSPIPSAGRLTDWPSSTPPA